MATKTKTAEGSANGATKTITKRKLTTQPGAGRVSKPVAAKKATPRKKTMAAQIPQEVIALRAYFIGETRMRAGLSGDSLSDWIEAERQLLAEFSK
jgi:hypothetical protein